MRGMAVTMVFFLVLTVIILFISIAMLIPLQGAFQEKSIDILSKLRPSVVYTFSTDDVLKDPNDPNDMMYPTQNYFMNKATPQSSDFCEDLKMCINNSLLKSTDCEIDISVPQESPGVQKGLAYTCDDQQIYTEDSDGNKQQVCKFVKPSAKQYVDLNYFDTGQSWDDCVKPYLPYMFGGYMPDNLKSFCSDRGSYVEAGSFNLVSFYPYYLNNPVNPYAYYYNFTNFRSGGRVKIFVYNVKVNDDIERTCSFDMMVAPQPAIASTKDDVNFQIFDLTYLLDYSMLKKSSSPGYVTVYSDSDYEGKSQSFYGDTRYVGDDMNDVISSLKLHNIDSVTVYPNDDYGESSIMHSRTYDSDISYVGDWVNDEISSLKISGRSAIDAFGYYPRPYTHVFAQGEYRPTLDEITEALRTGMLEWGKMHYRDQYAIDQYEHANKATYLVVNMSQWDVRDFNYSQPLEHHISYDTDCWNDEYFFHESGIGDYYYNDMVPSVLYSDGGTGFKDYSKLKIVIAMYKREAKRDVFNTASQKFDNADVIELVPMITVCAAK